MSDGMTEAYRNAISYGSKAERLVIEAMKEVETMGADVRLTDAVVLLMAARHRLDDFSMHRDGQRMFARPDDSEATEMARLREENGRMISALRSASAWIDSEPGRLARRALRSVKA